MYTSTLNHIALPQMLCILNTAILTVEVAMIFFVFISTPSFSSGSTSKQIFKELVLVPFLCVLSTLNIDSGLSVFNPSVSNC